MADAFRGPKLKVKRAEHHIGDLHDKLVAFGRTKFYSFRADKDAETGKSVLKFEIIKALPEEIPVVIGDAIHNLKSALDLTVNEVVRVRIGSADLYTRFPVRNTRNELVDTIRGGQIHKASQAVADFIVDVVKPYKGGGNDAIWSLHHLNILDKHRLLIPYVQVTSLLDVCAEDDCGNLMVNATLVLTRDYKIAAPFDSAGNIQIKSYRQPFPTIYFDKGLPYEGEPISPTLRDLANLVRTAIEGIETVFSNEAGGRALSED